MTEQNGRIRVSWTVIVTVVGWLVCGMLAYGALDGRIGILEDRYLRISSDINEMKADLKQLLRRSEP